MYKEDHKIKQESKQTNKTKPNKTKQGKKPQSQVQTPYYISINDSVLSMSDAVRTG